MISFFIRLLLVVHIAGPEQIVVAVRVQTRVVRAQFGAPSDGVSQELRALLERQRRRIRDQEAAPRNSIRDALSEAKDASSAASAAVAHKAAPAPRRVKVWSAPVDHQAGEDTINGLRSGLEDSGRCLTEPEPDEEPQLMAQRLSEEPDQQSEDHSVALVSETADEEERGPAAVAKAVAQLAVTESTDDEDEHDVIDCDPKTETEPRQRSADSTTDAPCSKTSDGAEDDEDEVAARRAALVKCVKAGLMTQEAAERCLQNFTMKLNKIS